MAAPQPPAATGPFVAVVTGATVNVRSGPSAQSAYVFGKLRQGDTVQVVAEEFGWAKVRTVGPAFAGQYAYVPADRRMTVQGEGRVLANARTDLRAPNLDAAAAPDKSWRQIGQVEVGTPLVLLGTVQGEKESVYKVALPATAEGWINMQFLRRANDQEATAFAAAVVAPTTGAPATTPPAATPPNTAAPANAAPVGAPSPASVGVDTQASGADTGAGPAIPPLLGQQEERAVPAGTRMDSHGEGSIGIEPHAQKARVVRESRRVTWADLEAQWEAVRTQPEAAAEIDALRGRYMELARTAPARSAMAQMATTRAEQLALLGEAQRGAQELAALRGQLSERSQAMYQIILDIQRRSDYTAVGILNASVVYDGQRLPQLYRITDPQTSQTIAYVLPNETLPMGTMVGTLVGVKGGKEFDSALNINVISPQVIELLIVRDTPQVSKVEVKSEQTKPATALAEKAPAPTTVPEAAPAAHPHGGASEDCPEEAPPGFVPDSPANTTR